MRATSSDIRDLLFETHMRLIAGSRSGLMVAMLRLIGHERGVMTFIEGVAAEYAGLLPSADELVAWIEKKLGEHGVAKVIPDDDDDD